MLEAARPDALQGALDPLEEDAMLGLVHAGLEALEGIVGEDGDDGLGQHRPGITSGVTSCTMQPLYGISPRR